MPSYPVTVFEACACCTTVVVTDRCGITDLQGWGLQKRMRIMYISTGLCKQDIYPDPNLGGPVQIWEVAKELAKRGHYVSILRAGSSNKEEVVDNVTLLSLTSKYETNVFYGIPSQLLFSKKSVSMIQSDKPDILCLQFRFSSYFPSKLDIPKIFTLHVPDALDYLRPYAVRHNILNYPLFYFKKMIETRVMSNSNEIVVLNKFMENYLKTEGYANVRMIPNAIDPNDFCNQGEDNFVLYAGRFDWNKRVDILIKAFSMSDEDHKKNFQLIIVGRGNKEQYLKHLVKSKNIEKYIKFVPWLERRKLMDLMSRCSVFVLPSLFECMPVTVLEAMASGKPVIASNIPGPQDIITHGYDGFLFERESVDELKRYLELCLSDEELRGRIGSNARKTAEQKYTFKKIADEYARLFKGLRLTG